MKYPRYEKYKDSGVEWLGEVPTHWENIMIGHLGTLMNGINKPKEAYGHGNRFVTVNNLYEKMLINQEALSRVEVTDAEKQRFKIRKHDILLARSSVKPDGVGYPATVGDPEEETVFAGFVIRFRVLFDKYINLICYGYYFLPQFVELLLLLQTQ